MNDPSLLYTFYGDDFTGSTDILEQLALGGVPAALFLAPPTPEQLDHFPGLRAFGVAGDARSQTPEWMDQHLPRLFEALRSFGAPITHYKVCSTFDSSRQVGNIGRAIEIGLRTFAPEFVPIVVGAPHLRRYVMDGRLFAAAPDGMIHRIDRHPMSRHPVTPMREPDLAKHLSHQSDIRVGHMPHDALASTERTQAALQAILEEGVQVVLFDTVDAMSLACIGTVLWAKGKAGPIFSASSSGLTSALLRAWDGDGLLQTSPSSTEVSPTSPLLVLSGSCSAATARQIQWSVQNGFHGIRIDPSVWLDSANGATRALVIAEAAEALNAARDVLIYTAVGESPEQPEGAALGASLGQLAIELLKRTAVQRVVFCGGDTSSHAVQELEVTALTWLASLDPGAPLCLAHRDMKDGGPFELVLKGGQVGAPDFFAKARGD
ncbi:Uncharacterized conserved protein YgbK, DUF1537 family [Bryocella elongata]|uniref:Uncharacterized conserved protein YgbK, DUF1537 family n=1 Tax=Bryocella elongata TaxID=863522 RepID=A0A1H6AWC7_9BACT|nr:four-carbon acid sugar kinase family protein [Bryocella elongata]SEG52931.1 Uncharacterized conserved protein YgbK, DUF1537 family [Bryocella elongata]